MSSLHRATSDITFRAGSAGLPICVVATTMAGTREAIAAASALAKALEAPIHVVAARAVPSEWSLDQQSAPVHAFAREMRQLTAGFNGPIDVLPCVCRRLRDVTQLLPQGALVIVAGPSHRWWPTREQRLAHDLNLLGHRVLFIHTPDETPAALAR